MSLFLNKQQQQQNREVQPKTIQKQLFASPHIANTSTPCL